MKKIVALVLSLVMVLGLATTAFAAVPLWTLGNGNSEFDSFDYDNTKTAGNLKVTYVKANAPVYDANGNCTKYGNIAYYMIHDKQGAFKGSYVLSETWVEGCVALKAANEKIDIGDAAVHQSAGEAVYFMVPIYASQYIVAGAKFADWGTTCGTYADPKDDLTYAKYTYAKAEVVQAYNKAVDSTDAVPAANILIDGVVYTMNDAVATKIAHDWVASKINTESGKVEQYTCSICKVVGTVVASSFVAPKDATLVELGGGTLIYYYPGVTTVGGDKVESAQTFDAGIAMYVGMSVMAAAGSAVVLKKKD